MATFFTRLLGRKTVLTGLTPLPAAPRPPLPADLRSRLEAIPEQVTLCRDLDRLWAHWLAGELEPRDAARLAEHRGSCARCRAVLAALAAARAAAAVSLPEALRLRLRRLPEQIRRRAPFWLVDVRYALVVSYLLAVFAFKATGEPARLVVAAAEPLKAATDELARAQEGLRELLDFEIPLPNRAPSEATEEEPNRE